MRLKTLSVKNVRTHAAIKLALHDGVTLITGKNGSGKTSLIEAIYIALRGKSFKDGDDAIVRRGENWYKIELSTSDVDRTVLYDYRTERKKKTYTVDTKQYLRLLERAKYPVILFEPDDMQMITGSPSRRRRYLDTMIAQYDPNYAGALRRYERALVQRNKLLKQSRHTQDELFAWNITLSRYGAEIVAARQEIVSELNERLAQTYQTIAPTNDTVSVRYSHSSPVSSQHLLTELEHSYERDRLLGTTTTGPHRHDLLVSFNDAPAHQTGSRGELRTITLSLKFIEALLVAEKTGEQPIILLDDVFSELDDTRQQRLLGEFHDNQLIMTSAHPAILGDDTAIISLT